MNAVDYLMNEHERFRKTFIELSDTHHRFETRLNLFHTLCLDLARHEKMEQEIFYPILNKEPKLGEIINHLIHEEKSAEKMMHSFSGITNEKEWEKKFKQFRKDVEHHASEEEGKLFPKVMNLLTEEQLQKIGMLFSNYKDHFQKAA